VRAPVSGSRPAAVAVPRQFRAMLNHYVFHTEAKKTAHLDPAKPLIIPAGSDSFDSIGTPPGARRAQMDGDNISARMQLWGKAVDTFFPPEKDDDADGKDEAVDAQQWLEPVVDTMRAQKQYVGIHVASVGPRAASGMASRSRVCVYVVRVCGCMCVFATSGRSWICTSRKRSKSCGWRWLATAQRRGAGSASEVLAPVLGAQVLVPVAGGEGSE